MLKKLPYIALYITRFLLTFINSQFEFITLHNDHDLRRGITESSPELADVLYQFPAHQQSKLLQVITVMMVVVN